MTVIRRAAKFIVGTTFNEIPGETLDIAKRALIDYLGVTLAGSLEPVSRKVHAYLNRYPSPHEATLYGTQTVAPVEHAALANGVSGHALDLPLFQPGL